jgi:YidC/Oxa1 family membrane protein insertase
MGMDKNTMIGFALIGALLIGMLYINNRGKADYDAQQKHIADSLALLKPKVDTTLAKIDALKADSLTQAKQTSGIIQDTAKPKMIAVENEVMKVTFNTKGAQPAMVELKKFKKYDSSIVKLQSGDFNKFTYKINTGNNQTAETENINFIAQPIVINGDKSQTISFKTGDSTGGKEIVHQYTIRPDNYMMDLNIIAKGADLFTQNSMNILWQTEASQIEKDHKYELTQSHVGYVKEDDFDFEYAAKDDSKTFDKSLSWIAAKQQFFIAALAAKSKFESGSVAWKVAGDSANFLFRSTVNVKLAAAANGNTALQFYYGPSDFNVLKKYDNKMENMVPYGTGMFSFVKYINRYFLLPVFDFLQRNIASMGIIILLITLLIRLITSPILYKSYLSGAKMKVLKPEVDALKAKFTDKTGTMDQQAFSMEQMKLWKTAGVSPLGGCLPALLQIPIFMSKQYRFERKEFSLGK